MFLSPRRGRGGRKFLEIWKQAFGLGTVAKLWPAGRAWDVNLAHQVERLLATGCATVDSGGKPKADGIRKARVAIASEARAIAGKIGDEWREAMKGVDVHAIRKTHRTWAKGVIPGAATDAQCGWSDGPTDTLGKVWRGSATGNKHYLGNFTKVMRGFLGSLGAKGVHPSTSASWARTVLDQGFKSVGGTLADAGTDATARRLVELERQAELRQAAATRASQRG